MRLPCSCCNGTPRQRRIRHAIAQVSFTVQTYQTSEYQNRGSVAVPHSGRSDQPDGRRDRRAAGGDRSDAERTPAAASRDRPTRPRPPSGAADRPRIERQRGDLRPLSVRGACPLAGQPGRAVDRHAVRRAARPLRHHRRRRSASRVRPRRSSRPSSGPRPAAPRRSPSPTSTAPRSPTAADIALITQAGPELAVPATKSYTTQVAALAVAVDALAPRGRDAGRGNSPGCRRPPRRCWKSDPTWPRW